MSILPSVNVNLILPSVIFTILPSKLSEYASRTSSSDLAVFVNFDMLITNIISIFPNLACVSSTSASKFEFIERLWGTGSTAFEFKCARDTIL